MNVGDEVPLKDESDKVIGAAKIIKIEGGIAFVDGTVTDAKASKELARKLGVK